MVLVWYPPSDLLTSTLVGQPCFRLGRLSSNNHKHIAHRQLNFIHSYTIQLDMDLYMMAFTRLLMMHLSVTCRQFLNMAKMAIIRQQNVLSLSVFMVQERHHVVQHSSTVMVLMFTREQLRLA